MSRSLLEQMMDADVTDRRTLPTPRSKRSALIHGAGAWSRGEEVACTLEAAPFSLTSCGIGQRMNDRKPD